MQHLMLFPEPSYWAETFLSTAGTTVPIFLQPWIELSVFTQKVAWDKFEFMGYSGVNRIFGISELIY